MVLMIVSREEEESFISKQPKLQFECNESLV